MSKDVMDEVFPEVEAEEPEAEQVEVQPETQAEAVAEPEQVADEGEQEGEPPAPAKEPENHIPVSALKDERAKRQAVERELAEMRQWRQQMEARARDHQLRQIEDPDERMQAYQQQWQQAAVSQKLEMSRSYAVRQHGADFVAEVTEFFNDPAHSAMSHQFLRSEDPFGAAVDYFNAQKALREIGTDPKAYEAKLREQLRAELMAELSPTKPKAPPPSMASAPAAGGKSQPIGTGYDALFGG